MPVSGPIDIQPGERDEPLCEDCRHYESDCICWLGEWCPTCQEFECAEDTHHA